MVRRPLNKLKARVEKGPERWRRYLADLEHRPGLGSTHADLVRSCWTKLAEAEADLPLPMADRTPDETAFQFAWSYASVLLEVEVSEGGELYWYGNDRILGTSEDGSVTVPEPVPAALKGWLEKVANA